ncbi:MAG: hypothetical protein LBO07_07800 [Coriobacteriales bacterium]|jgi:hypothetical protein|nr:hypothetical protein [Coriobacteriales bacterium]
MEGKRGILSRKGGRWRAVGRAVLLLSVLALLFGAHGALLALGAETGDEGAGAADEAAGAGAAEAAAGAGAGAADAETVAGAADEGAGSEATAPASPSSQIQREYVYDARQGAPEIPLELEEEGRIWRLVRISEPRAAEGFVHERHYRATRMLPIAPEVYERGREAILACFDAEAYVDDEDYAGALPLVSLDCQAIYRLVERQIERSAHYPGLASEDIRQLPQYATFETSDAASPGARVTQSLERTGVLWQTTGHDADGRPHEFAATVIFRGIESELALDYWQATVTYEGAVFAKAQMVGIIATYEPAPVLSATQLPATLPVTIAPVQVPLAMPSAPFSWARAAMLVISLLVLVLLGVLYVLFYYNARLVRIDGAGHSRVIVRRHLRCIGGVVTFVLPADISPLSKTEKSRLVLSGALVRREGELVFEWGGQKILKAALQERYELDEVLLSVLSEGIGADVTETGEGLPLQGTFVISKRGTAQEKAESGKGSPRPFVRLIRRLTALFYRESSEGGRSLSKRQTGSGSGTGEKRSVSP